MEVLDAVISLVFTDPFPALRYLATLALIDLFRNTTRSGEDKPQGVGRLSLVNGVLPLEDEPKPSVCRQDQVDRSAYIDIPLAGRKSSLSGS